MKLLIYEALLSDGSSIELFSISKANAWLTAQELAGDLQIIKLTAKGDW